MNLRISENSVRFRITAEDLEILIQGRNIDQRICMGAVCFSYRISPVSSGMDMRLEMGGNGFSLSVPRNDLEQLRALGRSREGISILHDGVDVSLQLDLKSAARRETA